MQEIEGKHHSILLSNEDRESASVNELWNALMLGEACTGERRVIANDGRDVWLDANYVPVRDRSVKVWRVVNFVADITSRKARSLEDAGEVAVVRHTQAVVEFNLDGNVIAANANFLGLMNVSVVPSPPSG